MELIGGLVIVAVLLGAAGLGAHARRHPSANSAAETSVSEREWMDAIK